MPDPLEELAPLLRERRETLGLSLREAARVSDVPVATLSRIEQGQMPDLATFRRIVEWIGEDPSRFFTATERAENTAEVIAAHLRSDSALTPAAAERIADIVRDLYSSLATPDRNLAVHLRAAKTFAPAALVMLTEILEEMQVSLEREFG